MKRVFALLFLFVPIALTPDDSHEKTDENPRRLRLMSYNFQCRYFCGAKLDFATRLQLLEKDLRAERPRILALQELFFSSNRAKVRSMLSGILARKIALEATSDLTIYFDAHRFKLLERGTVNLPSPIYPPRRALWLRLRDNLTERRFIVLNTHFDNNPPRQRKSAEILRKHIAAWGEAGTAVIALGDFNSSSNGRSTVKRGACTAACRALTPLRELGMLRAYEIASERKEHFPRPKGFFLEHMIDHVLILDPGKKLGGVREWNIRFRSVERDGKRAFASDHWPIGVTLDPDTSPRANPDPGPAEKCCARKKSCL